MFKEDAENKIKIPIEAREGLISKFQALYDVSHKEESKQAPKNITEVVRAIEEECFSDLNPEDIPDDCISDIGDNVNENQTLE